MKPCSARKARDLLDLLAGEAVDDAGVARVLAAQEAQQLPARRRASAATRYWMFGRSKPPIEDPVVAQAELLRRSRRASARPPSRCRPGAARPGSARRSTSSCRYSGRKSWPHWETQWASSMAKSAMRQRSSSARVRSWSRRSGAK